MKQRIIRCAVSETDYQKILHKKEDDNFGDREFGEWLAWIAQDVKNAFDYRDEIGRGTARTLLKLWCQNFAQNLPFILEEAAILEIVPTDLSKIPINPSVVVGAGPSIYEHKHLELLSEYIRDGRYKGIVVATDRMLVPCLEHEITPHISITVDGSPKIQKFFEHPKVMEYGSQLKIVLTCTTSPLVAEACRKAKAPIYWYNPMFDDVRRNESFSRMQKFTTMSDRHPNGLANVSCGGNAGTAGWVFSHSLLRHSPIALIGLDLGFPEGTPLKETPYYSGILENVGGNAVVAAQYGFQYFVHPIFKTKSYADPVFCNYRASLREVVLRAPPYVRTYNCSEGVTLWGEKITCIPFQEFLDKVACE